MQTVTAEPNPRARTPRFVSALLLGALVATVGVASAERADAAGLPPIQNAEFGVLNASGRPAGWQIWNPAGTASVVVEPTGAPGGRSAVAITSTSGATARLALTQSLTVDDSMPRRLTLRGLVRGTALNGGFSMLRVQGYNAAGQVVLPVAQGPYLTGSFDWRESSTELTLPVGTVRLSVEAMLDRGPGTIRFTGLQLVESTAGATLTAGANAAGTVELRWTFGVANPDRFAVYRGVGTSAPVRDAAHRVRTARALTTADDSVVTSTTYAYQVEALAADGSILATSPVAVVTTPPAFDDSTDVTTLTAIDRAGQVHVSWAVAEGQSTGALAVQIGSGASVPVQGVRGAIDVPGGVGEQVSLRAGAAVLASATVGRSAHPRALLDAAAVDRVNAQLDSGAVTTTAAWQATLDRVAGPGTEYPANGSAELYRGRDAAFVYAITGELTYAQQAYEALLAGSPFVAPRPTNMGLELARAALMLAPAYDWAHNGWSEAQRAGVRSIMTRAVDLLSTYHHPALDDEVKTSNWVGVARSTELALLLAARGDGDFGDHDERIAFLLDQTNRHLEQAYTDTGFTQEGWDYLHYTELYMFPSVFFAQEAGIQTLDAEIERPAFWNLALHVVSSRSRADTLQFGVSGPNGQVDGSFPLLFPLAPAEAIPGLKHLYDRVQGDLSDARNFDGVHGLWTVLFYPEEASGDAADLEAESANRALLEDDEGFYAFRSRYRDRDDTLIATASRNRQHRGWSSAETFSLSWIGNDTTWATLGGKAWTNPLLWSKPLVDGRLEPYANQYETATGAGVTLESRAFDGQGGGYLRLDGAGNFAVDTSLREEVVDLAVGGAADAVVAIRDVFGDSGPHRWDWQLRPESGVAIALHPDTTEDQPLFTFTSPNGSVLSGFVLDRAGLTAAVIDGTVRLSREGTSAEFRVALATSAGGALPAAVDDGRLVLDGRSIDFDALDASTESGLPAAVP